MFVIKVEEMFVVEEEEVFLSACQMIPLEVEVFVFFRGKNHWNTNDTCKCIPVFCA